MYKPYCVIEMNESTGCTSEFSVMLINDIHICCLPFSFSCSLFLILICFFHFDKIFYVKILQEDNITNTNRQNRVDPSSYATFD